MEGDKSAQGAVCVEAMANAVQSAVDKALASLAGVCGLESQKADLGEIARKAREAARMARDIGSGAEAQRKEPLAKVWSKAQASGSLSDWTLAFAELAQASLGEARPAWYAGAMLSMLKAPLERLGSEQAAALAGPILEEKALGGSYDWSFPKGQEQPLEAWQKVCSMLP